MELFNFMKKLPTRNELKGGLGENLVKFYTKFTTDALVLHDVLIHGENGYTSQIDLLIIGCRGIYVVEVKTYDEAKIYGNGKNSKWYYYKHNKKYEIYSPLKQNKKHIEYLKKLLNGFGDIPCFSILTIICEDFKITNINQSNNIDTVICNSLPAMNKALRFFAENKPEVFDKAKKQEIFEFIKNNQLNGKQARYEHKENVKEYKNKLDEMERQKICPYCKIPLVLRKGKYGEFYGCANYPKCRFILKNK